MKPRRILSAQETTEILDCAVHDSALAVLSVFSDNDWLCFKSRFLERDGGRRFFVLDWGAAGEEPPPLALGQYVGVSFRHKSRKIMFATVLEARGRFMSEGGKPIAAARYRWPESLTELQRRAYHRTIVPAGVSIPVTAWPGGRSQRSAAQLSPQSVLAGECVDLSCGGTLIRVTQSPPPNWQEDQTVGMELHLPDGRQPVLLDGHYRGMRIDGDDHRCAAMQFVGLEMSVEGRNTLQRLARCVQRFNRLTLAPELRKSAGQYPIG
jgi:c-di-GMP-binding flagellar brake protein YcgR